MERNTPTVLVLTRQNVPILDRTQAIDGNVARGAYVLIDGEGGSFQVLLIGSGSEVDLCVQAHKRLKELGVQARVVSMPSWELFREQSPEYQNSVIPPEHRKRVTVEAASTMGWEAFAGLDGAMIGINQFGASASAEEIMVKFGFTAQHVTAAALHLLGRHEEADREIQAETNGDTAVAPTSSQEGHS